jgi:threonine dehydrogenase-like Zn-dependent dehydrogenase
MKALVWHGTADIRCESVPDPRIEHERDAIIKVTSCAICGSDLHLFDHFMPGMKSGDIMGHETMGEVVEVGSGAKSALKVGDRVVIPFTIICGECEQCRRGNFSVCETTNRNKDLADKAFGHSTAGLFGDDLLNRVLENQIDPSFVITHTEPLERGPEMYKTFRDKQDGCIKVVLKPGANGAMHA